MPATTGFALAVTARLASASRKAARKQSPEATAVSSRDAAVFWISEDVSLRENGAPYAPGLDQTGIAPEGLITVRTARTRETLWAMEEALSCGALGVVIGEIRAGRIDQVATRRLSLAAGAGGTLGLLLRPTPDDEPSAAVTRWMISAVPSRTASIQRNPAIGAPRFAVRLVRNRHGRLGSWIVEWNSVEQRFRLTMHSERMAGAVLDRPRRAAVA